MSISHQRRSRLIGLSIQQHSWDLETLRYKNRMAVDSLVRANSSLNEIEAVIERTERLVRQGINGKSALDLTAIQMARLFLADQQDRRRKKLVEQQRANQRARQLEMELKEGALYVKGLSQVKASIDQALNVTREKRASEEDLELWMRCYK